MGGAVQEGGEGSGQLGPALRWSRTLGGRVMALEFGDKGAMTAMLGRVSAYSEGQGKKGACVRASRACVGIGWDRASPAGLCFGKGRWKAH